MTELYVLPMAEPEPRFPLGDVYITPAAQETLPPEDVGRALTRHSACDWGDVADEDRSENEYSLEHGCRLLSVYHTRADVKFWIITEADRSATTILLPQDY